MITNIYWGIRIFGYVASLAGVFLYLYHQADADPAVRNLGLGLVGIGFVAFFVSYTIRAWLRFGLGRKTEKE